MIFEQQKKIITLQLSNKSLIYQLTNNLADFFCVCVCVKKNKIKFELIMQEYYTQTMLVD